MLTALIVIIGLSLLILAHEAGHFFVAKFFKLKVDEFGFGFPPRIFAKKKGETEYSINALPFGGFVKIAGENDHLDDPELTKNLSEEEKKRTFLFQKAYRRSLIIAAGVIVNFVVGWLLLSLIFMIGTPPALIISGVQENSPAKEIGLKSGDIVKDYIKAAAFVDFVNQNKGKEIELNVIRNGEKLSFKATPRLRTEENQGALGVELGEAGIESQPFFESIVNGLKQSFVIAGVTVLGFYELIKNLISQGSLIEGIVGPVGIFGVAHQASSIGFIYLLQLVSLISINLAVVNLLPFPALDGGRLFMILIEKIKRSPISRKVEAAINTAGFVFLLLLMVLITIRDIANLF